MSIGHVYDPDYWKSVCMELRKSIDTLDLAHRADLIAFGLERYGNYYNLYGYPQGAPENYFP